LQDVEQETHVNKIDTTKERGEVTNIMDGGLQYLEYQSHKVVGIKWHHTGGNCTSSDSSSFCDMVVDANGNALHDIT
jgi:hypothetical protein